MDIIVLFGFGINEERIIEGTFLKLSPFEESHNFFLIFKCLMILFAGFPLVLCVEHNHIKVFVALKYI